VFGSLSIKGKRKQSGTHPDLAMFTWEVLDNVLLTHSITQYKQEDDRTKMMCVLLGCTFKNSLECRTFNLSAISLTVSMLNDAFFLFQCALHPKTRHATFPCPQNGNFLKANMYLSGPQKSKVLSKPYGQIQWRWTLRLERV